MHDRLRTLPPEQKRRWPEHLPELVYAYNCTPHSTTGYAPYYLFFGREPVPPIDHLLGFDEESHGEWLADHHQKLKLAFEFAQGHNLRKKCWGAKNDWTRLPPTQVFRLDRECSWGTTIHQRIDDVSDFERKFDGISCIASFSASGHGKGEVDSAAGYLKHQHAELLLQIRMRQS